MNESALPGNRSWADVDQLLTARAKQFETARIQRQAALDRERQRKRRRTDRQFWFLFALTFLCFITLAFRTEWNDQALHEGLYNACVDRVEQTKAYNQGRESLITAVINNPENPVPPQKQAQTIAELRQGLLLPLEECGDDPAQ